MLFVCYFFPPFGAGGVFRALKFAKYLPEFGWKPTILTVNPVGAWVTDDSLLEQVKCPVVATSSFHPVGRFRKWKDNHPQASPMLKRCLRLICEQIPDQLMLPDTRAGWVPFAIREGMRLHRNGAFDLMLTNSPPHSSHAIGWTLKKLTGIPWVADFKDGWLHNPFRTPRNWFREKIESRMERCIVRNVDHLVTISQPLANYFEAMATNPVSVIPNGYDEEDFQSIESSKDKRITIGYFGSIFGDRDPTNFLRGVERYMENHKGQNPRIIFVGPVEGSAQEKIEGFSQLDVEIIPYLPHAECLRLMKSCHALLTLVGDDPRNDGVLTGKIFEYLRAEVPIVAICPKNGALWKFLDLIPGAFLGEPDQIKSIAEAVRQTMEFSSSSENCEFPKNLRRFERKNLTGQIADLFHSVAESG